MVNEFLSRSGIVVFALVLGLFASIAYVAPAFVLVILALAVVWLLFCAVTSRGDWTFGSDAQIALPKILVLGLVLAAISAVRYLPT